MWMERVDQGRELGLYHYGQAIDEYCGPVKVRLAEREMLMFASYGYLGLLNHPRICEAAKEAIDRYGTCSHGARLLAGTISTHVALERTIAEFKGTEDALTFSSGFVTNVAVIAALVGRHDAIVCDFANHASIVDGAVLSRATMYRYDHDDMADLERKLQLASKHDQILVVSDAVFSMGGDVANLPRILELCKKYQAKLMIDEAHAVGVLGERGRGIEEHFGLGNVIDIKMGTLSKAIPSIGGYVAGSRELINFLRHNARGYVFTASLPPASVVAARVAFEVVLEEPQRVGRLREKTQYFLKSLRAAGLDTMNSSTPIIPIVCGSDEKAYLMTRLCRDQGIFVMPVVSPAVPEGLARLRVTITSEHTKEELDRAVQVFAEAARTLEII